MARVYSRAVCIQLQGSHKPLRFNTVPWGRSSHKAKPQMPAVTFEVGERCSESTGLLSSFIANRKLESSSPHRL